MAKNFKRGRSDVPSDAESPIEAAISARDADVLAMVTEAVHHKEAMLAFQPVVRAQVQSSAAFHEGLIRLLDETGRVIPAAQFMPQVEERELGRQLDVLAIDFGCRALSKVPRLRLSINMSARSIGYQPWMETLDRWLRRDESIGPRLILEITESSAMQVPELVIDFMDRLQMRGVCFALDDFGAGFTALRYFKDFFFDVLKIDGQFVRGIAQDEDNVALTRAMIGIGHQFDMLTVAEMVETEEEARILCELGVDCLQGYFFGAPTTQPSWLPAQAPGNRRAG